MSPYYTKGSVIKCPGCNKKILQLTRDVFPGEAVDESIFKGINGHDNPRNGEFLRCKFCNSHYNDPDNITRFNIDDSAYWGPEELEVVI